MVFMIEANSYLLNPVESKIFQESFPHLNKICRSQIRDIAREDYQESLIQRSNFLSKEWKLDNFYLMIHSTIFSLGVRGQKLASIIDDSYIKEIAPCDVPPIYLQITKILEDESLMIDISVSKIFILEHNTYRLHQPDESEKLTFYPVKASTLVADITKAHKDAHESLSVLKIISKLYQ